MKIKITELVRYSITLLIVLNTKIFLFGDWDSLFKKITMLVSIVLFFLVVLQPKAKRIISKYKLLNIWMVFFWLFLLANGIVNHLKFGTGYGYILAQTYHYFALFLIYPLLYVFEDDKRTFYKIINSLYFWGIISMIIRILVWYLYNYLGIDFMHYLVYEAGVVWTRNNRQRIPVPCLTCFVFAVGVSKITCKKDLKEKLNGLLSTLLVLFFTWVVTDARSSILIFGIVITCIYIFKGNKVNLKYLKVFLIIVFAALIFLVGGINKYISSISSFSIVARVQAFEYYYELFKTNMLLGVKFMSSGVEIERGPWNYFYFTDLGTMSKFVEFGLIGAILHFAPLFYMMISSIKIKNVSQYLKIIMLGIASYACATAFITLDPYFARNFFFIPFSIAIFEFINNNYSKCGIEMDGRL